MDTWGQEFYAVYVLPVRDLQQSQYDGKHYTSQKTLATAIVNICFANDLPTKEPDYNRLREHIEEELKKSTTLVILDGLDEQAGTSKEILRQAQAGAHKLLMLSRSHGVETERQAAGIEVEHRGFNEDQLKSYVRNAFKDAALAESLLAYIERSESIQKIVHIPVHLEIVCNLWQDESSGVREALGHGSLPSLYRKFTTWIWKRYAKKWDLKKVSAEPLFNTLGQIALDAFKPGKKISSDFVNDYVETEEEESMLQDAGLLQCVVERSEDAPSFYQFAHKTFQEYFAGRWLAVQFLADEDTREQCKEFLENYKYDSSYGQTLPFFSGELHSQLGERSSKHRCDQLSRLLAWLDSEPKEVVGLQHALLQAGMLHEWLCMAKSDEHGAFVSTGSQVLDNLQKWLSKSIKISYLPQGQQVVEQLMREYWDRKDPELTRYIVAKLQQTPLVIRPSRKRDYNEEAVLYLEGGGCKVWRGASEEIAQFRDLLVGELNKDKDTFHAYSHGDLRKVVSYLERALAIKEQSYQETPNHPDIAMTLNNLGNAWGDLGDARQAVSYYQRALAMKEQVYQETPNHPEIASTLVGLGNVWSDLGDARQGVSFYDRALAIFEQSYQATPNHPDIANTLNNLGNAWGDLGDARQAISFHQRALAIYEQSYQATPNHPDIANTLNNLGNAWGALGDARQAVSFYDRALTIKEQVYQATPNHPSVAGTLNNLGIAWRALGDATKAREYLERALAIDEQVYQATPNHPSIAGTLNNLGIAWRALGDARQAVSYYDRALAMKEQVYQETPNHPHIASTLNNLGAAWRDLGDAKQAVSFYERALAIYEQSYQATPNHPDIASTLNNLGIAYKNLGNYTQALEHYQQALEMQKVLHEGENHDEVADSLRTVAIASENSGNYTQALEYFKQALQMQKALHEGENHAQVAYALRSVGIAYHNLGNHAQALEYFQQALQMQKALHEGENHAQVAAALRSVGVAYERLSNYAQALEYYQQALKMQKALHEGEKHAEVAAALNDVGLAYFYLGSYTQVLEYCQQALQMYQALHEGKDHAEVARNLRNVAITCENLGKYTQALEYYQQALKMQKALHEGENHAEVAQVLRNVGVAYERLGNYTEALNYYQQALTMQKALHEGENHDDVAAALRAVGVAYERLGNYTEALEYYQKALEMQKALHEGENHAEVAQALYAVGLANYYLGHLEEVIQNWEQALAVPAVSQAMKAVISHGLGIMYHIAALAARQEDDEQRAQAYLEKATLSFEQAVEASDGVKAGLYAEYGNFLLATEQFTQAYDYLHQAIKSGDGASSIVFGLIKQQIVTPILQAYLSQQQAAMLRGIDYAYYLMILHYEDFQKAGMAMTQTRDAYLAAYQASIDQCSGQPGQEKKNKTAYYLLGSLYKAQGDQAAAAAAFARVQDGTEQEDTQAAA